MDVGRRHHDAVLVEEHLGVDVGIGDRQVHHRAVEAAARDLGEQRGRRGVDDDELDPGVALVSSRNSAGTSQRAVVPITPIRTAPTDLAAFDVEVGVDGLELVLDASGPVDDGLALDGERAGGAFDEGDPELALEPGDVGRDVGLHGCSERAAAEKLAWSATATSARSCRRSIAANDATYRSDLLDRSCACIHNGPHIPLGTKPPPRLTSEARGRHPPVGIRA